MADLTTLADDFTILENAVWYGGSDEGRLALERVQARLAQALGDNEVLAERVRDLTDSALARRVGQLEAQLNQARDSVERAGRILGG